MHSDYAREDIGHRLRLVVDHDVLVRRHPATWEGIPPLQLLDGPVETELSSIWANDVIAGKLESVRSLLVG
jgi:hypothetical protein